MQRDKVLESEIISEAHGRDYSRHTLDFYQVQNLNSGKENIKGDRKPTNNDIIGKYKYKNRASKPMFSNFQRPSGKLGCESPIKANSINSPLNEDIQDVRKVIQTNKSSMLNKVIALEEINSYKNKSKRGIVKLDKAVRKLTVVGGKTRSHSTQGITERNDQYYNIKASKESKHSSEDRKKNRSCDLFKISSIPIKTPKAIERPMSAINSNPNNYNKVSKEVCDCYSNFVNGNNEVNDIGLRNYEYIKERIFHNSDSNPYDFLSDKSILNKLKRELFGKQNNLVIDTDIIN